MQLEVLVTSVEEAKIAQSAGASRVELVAEFERDGLTPSDALTAAVAQAVSIPVYVMLRPHDSGYVYDRSERQALVARASRMRDLGAAAIVFGALDQRNRIAAEVVCEVLASSGLPMTFHRAFDRTDASASYALLAGIPGVERVLTSGCLTNVWEGRHRLRELCAGNTAPLILAGGGVTLEGLPELLRFTGVREVHVGSAVRTNGTVDGALIERFVHVLNEDYEGSAV